jgi:hypothetical protein
MASDVGTPEAVNTSEASKIAERKRWVAPTVVISTVARVTAAKTSSGFGFETHSPGSLNGS